MSGLMALRRQEIRQEIAIALQNYAAGVRWVQGVQRNRTYTSSGSAAPGGFGAAGSTTIYAAAMVNAKASGIFLAAVSWGWQQAATGTWRAQVITQTTAAGTMTLSNTTATGPATLGGTGNGAFTTSAAAGITVTAGAGSKTQADTGVQTQGTAATAATYDWTGIVHNATGTTETGFAVGNQVLLTLTLITTTAAITASTQAPFISLVELA